MEDGDHIMIQGVELDILYKIAVGSCGPGSGTEDGPCLSGNVIEGLFPPVHVYVTACYGPELV